MNHMFLFYFFIRIFSFSDQMSFIDYFFSLNKDDDVKQERERSK